MKRRAERRRRSTTTPPKLRVGERVRILAVPGSDISNFRLSDDTRRLYERLVSKRIVLRVRRIDDQGLAWVQHRFKNALGTWEQHFLGLTDADEWERVRSRPTRKTKSGVRSDSR